MKRCTRCGGEKPLDAFPPVRRGEATLQSWCRGCFAAYGKAYYRNNREAQKARLLRNVAARREDNQRRMVEYLSLHPCVDCSEADVVVLELDHLRDKEANIATLVSSGASWARIERELEKCEVRCANCHRQRTLRLARRKHPRDPTVPSRPRCEQLWLSDVASRACRVCGRELVLAMFPVRSRSAGTRQWICLECQRETSHRWYVRTRAPSAKRVLGYGRKLRAETEHRIDDYFSTHPCVDCGESDRRMLDFDHQRDKVMDVSSMVVNGWAWDAIEAEIAKCEVRCVKCHRRRTSRRVSAYRFRLRPPSSIE